MNSGMPLFDATYSRHQGSETSVEANLAANVSKLKRALQIYALAVRAGSFGITSREIELETGKAKNTFSGRITDLKIGVKHGNITVKLVPTDRTRDNCRVLVADIFANGEAIAQSVQ